MTSRVKELRAELDAATEQAAIDAQLDSARDAYATERWSVLQRISRLRTIAPDTQFVIRPSLAAMDMPAGAIGIVGPTVADLIAQAEGDLAEIDATLERLER